MRPLGIPVMKCRAMQALHLLALEPIAETTADPNSYGFRPERSTADAGEQCFISLAKKACAEWVLEADIQGCFDKISHDWMLANISTDKATFRTWLKAGYVYQNELFPTDAGTPQGGIISPVAANMALDGLEGMLAEKFPRRRHAETGLKINMVRYADDFIITGCSKELLELQVKPAVIEFLAERGLVLSPEKTKITHIKEGFDFLGWNIRKYNGKLLIKPSKTNVKAHLDKIREIIKANKTAKQDSLINLLNPILRGWANYHSHVVAKKVFARVDHEVWSMLWRWAVRRHPNKGARWVKKRYFKTQGNRHWVFAATEEKEDGTKKERILFKATDTPIQRHIKIRATANPHDPQWGQYFEARWGKKMLNSGRGRAKLYRVWLRQDRLCPDCQKPITKHTPWDVRFTVKRADGGTNAASNLQMYHPICHGNQKHAENEVV
jgi:RNA-directed DNA polymerase